MKENPEALYMAGDKWPKKLCFCALTRFTRKIKFRYGCGY